MSKAGQQVCLEDAKKWGVAGFRDLGSIGPSQAASGPGLVH